MRSKCASSWVAASTSRERGPIRSPMNEVRWHVSALLLAVLVAGCFSPEIYAAKRRQELLRLYPPGTARADVQARFEPLTPELAALRPADGWSAESTSAA